MKTLLLIALTLFSSLAFADEPQLPAPDGAMTTQIACDIVFHQAWINHNISTQEAKVALVCIDKGVVEATPSQRADIVDWITTTDEYNAKQAQERAAKDIQDQADEDRVVKLPKCCHLGMTEQQVKHTRIAYRQLDKPDSINRTIVNGLVHEQWVYEGLNVYLYFDNGKLVNHRPYWR